MLRNFGVIVRQMGAIIVGEEAELKYLHPREAAITNELIDVGG